MARQHASGRLTVRERIERLFDEGSFHETGALAGRGELWRRRRPERLPARQHGDRPGPDRRAPRGRAGRRLHDPRRRRRRRDLGEDRLRGAARARPAHPARAARGRHGRRRLGQDARADGLLVRAAAAGLRPGGREPVDRARRRRRARAHRRPRRRPRRVLALLGDRAGQRSAVRGRAAGGRDGRDRRDARQGGARRRPHAGARRGGRQRRGGRGRRARPAAPLPLLPAAERLGGAAARSGRDDPPERREEELLSIVPRDPRRPYKMRRILEQVLDRDSLFELGAAFGRPDDHLPGAARRQARRRARLGPGALRRRGYGRCRRQDGALRGHLRPVPPAGRQLRRRARAS